MPKTAREANSSSVQGEIVNLLPNLSEKMALLLGAAALWDKDLTPETVKIWRDRLNPCSLESLEWAFRRWQDTNDRFFPKPKNIMDLVAEYVKQKRTKFKPCDQNGCDDGWIHVYEGKTVGGHDVNPKIGAVKRCECFTQYATGLAKAVPA